jgi:hypothetical protein
VLSGRTYLFFPTTLKDTQLKGRVGSQDIWGHRVSIFGVLALLDVGFILCYQFLQEPRH